MLLSMCVFFLLVCNAFGQAAVIEPGDLERVAQDSVDLTEADDAKMLTSSTSDADIVDLSALRYVSLITRHGSRSPVYSYPTDPYPLTDLKYWPDGPGQLTRFGKQQLFKTGRILRRRYNGFLSVNYYSNETTARSNPYDRDFMSAASLLAGLYPPTGYQIWNKRISWQPIPIWERRSDISEIERKPNICPRYIEERTKSLNELDSHSSKYSDLLQYLSEHMGVKMNKISDTIKIWDALKIQAENGYSLPSWTNKVFPNELNELDGIAYRSFISGSTQQTRLHAGPLLKVIVDQLNTKAKGVMRPNRKLYIEAAHDSTIRALLSGLEIRDAIPIETSAFMAFELYENPDGYTVRSLFFRNSSTPSPRVLDLPTCTNPCSLQDFNTAVHKYIPDNWKEECQNTTYQVDGM